MSNTAATAIVLLGTVVIGQVFFGHALQRIGLL